MKRFLILFLATVFAYGQGSYSEQTKITFKNEYANDAFGRFRMSLPYTEFDTQNEYTASETFWEHNLINGADTNFYFNGQPVVDLITTADAGNRGIRQTRKYFRYESGVSKLVMVTLVPGTGKSGMRKLWGYGDSLNGIFFGMDSDSLFVMKRSNASGSVVDSVVYQGSWNVDRGNGAGGSTNASNFKIKTYTSNLFWIDIAWLGVQSVRLGTADEAGNPIVLHRFLNGNNNPGVYMRTANLPVHFSIRHRSGTSQVDTLRTICAAVKREGGGGELDGDRHIASTWAFKTVTGSFTPILSIRPKLTFNGVVNRGTIEDISAVLAATGQIVEYRVLYDATLTGASWNSLPTVDGREVALAEYDTSATAYTGGRDIGGDMVVAGGVGVSAYSTSSASSILSKLPMYVNIAGTSSSPITIIVRSATSGGTAKPMIRWKEIH